MSRRKKQEIQEDDAFVRGIYRTVEWVQRNSRTVTVAAVLAVLGVGAWFYYRDYQAGLREEASAEFQRLQSAVAGSPPDTLALHLQDFVSRYGGTEYARRGRMLLARIHLSNDRWDEAISALEPLSDDPSTPTGYAVTRMLAAAQESAGRVEEALRQLERLADNARFAFQRRAADADRARLLVEAGRLEEAASIYERLAAETPEGAPDAGEFAVRLGEVRAALRSGASLRVEPPSERAAAAGADSGAAGEAASPMDPADSAASTPDTAALPAGGL